MIKIEDKQLMHNLEKSYNDFQQLSINDNKEELFFMRGFCTALEQIAILFGGFTKEQIDEIKRPIIGDINMPLKKDKNLDVPTHMRKNINIYDTNLYKKSKLAKTKIRKN